jgi:hypothetical protein
MTIIVFDVRCLQDPMPAPRITAHARRLISLARHVCPLARGATLIGVTDPALPALQPREAAWLDETRPNAYLPEASGDAIFLNPATARDPIFVGRLLLRADIFKTAIIEDFAAVDNPAPESEEPVARLRHATTRAWLRRYDLLLPMAADTMHPEQAAKTAWDIIATQFVRAELPRFAIGGRRPRIAMLTPMPPIKSGVADYSAQTVKALEKHADVSVFGPGATEISAVPHLARRFDRVVSVMGNSSHHGKIYDFHARCGSAIICHDSRLMHFFTEKYGVEKTAGMAAKELGRKVSDAEILAWHNDETRRDAMCLGDLPETAHPFICHSKAMAAQVTALRKKPAVHLPFAIYRPWDFGALSALRKHEARERLGIPRKEKLIVTFGFVNASKAVAETLAALDLLNGYARLIWAGEAHIALPKSPHVTFLNQFIPETTYRDYLLAADCGLQLRIGGAGNISGALQDCIAAGLPTVASADLAESLEAPSYIRRVADVPDPAEIARQLSLALTWKTDTEYERADYAGARSMDAYAAGLLRVLSIG